MTSRLRISSINENLLNQNVTLNGWVRTRRGSKGISFIQLYDGSNQNGIQAVADEVLENYEEISKLTTGASVSISGKVVESPAKGQAFEIHAEEVRVIGVSSGDLYPLQKKGHTLEFLREIAHLRPRTNTLGAVFRLRNTLSWAIHSFFQERDFLYVQTPIITANDAEGAGEMFHVTALDLENLPKNSEGKVDYSKDFFGTDVSLTVSGQLGSEVFALAFTDVYTFGPTFRAENSNTSRHLAEFWMIEPEMAFTDLQGMLVLTEEFLKYVIGVCLERHEEELEFLQKMYEPQLLQTLKHIHQSQFETLTYTEAVDILQKSGESFEFPVEWGVDLQSEHERFLTEKHVKKPINLIDYPAEIKAFYMKQNADGKTVSAMDVLFPRLGEIVGGSQREDSLETLSRKMKEHGLPGETYDWYLDLRRFGSAPHSGFGLGFERLVQFVSGMKNIRDVIPFPRVPGNANF
ncbi:MAG: asparagine--tRNA ligase [SAR324 cluster bacterium]|nr:asparagine--tRNA ligase [SAR324 cluster bacterium]MEC8981571.1 asparagine--tRNA ligase [SAR324 cluster bacterium]MEC9011791.1 asparagine--tRNA ligase [SAR324 cluster bacterium]